MSPALEKIYKKNVIISSISLNFIMSGRLFARGVDHPFGTEWDKSKKDKVLTSDQRDWIGMML